MVGESPNRRSTVTLFLCGDVMTGRGIDQILPAPGDPVLHEPTATSALEYVQLAEAANGPIPRSAPGAYIWGIAIEEFARIAPDVKFINLETSITKSPDFDPDKRIHYRMHPDNIGCLAAAGIDCCAVANNHVLDWGQAGLRETLATLSRVGIATAGAGGDLAEARRPAVFKLPGKGRVLFLTCGCESAGVSRMWAATEHRPGVWFIDEGSSEAVDQVAACVSAVKQPRDLAVLSMHWGDNWGYRIPEEQRQFAHAVIDRAGVDVVHGHSSHHVKGMEVYHGRPIFYGCGDLLTDYEGISGYEAYRGDLGLMYFVTMDPATGRLLQVDLRPTQVRQFRLTQPSATDATWLGMTLDCECRTLGTSIIAMPEGRFQLQWRTSTV